MKPYFSIIVPVYGVEKFLSACVDSILGQTFSDFELILVDDGSPDNCPAMCDAYAQQDRRIAVIHKPNGGLAQARKSGLLQATADYVCFVDSDDYVVPQYLDIIHRCIEENGYPDVVIHGMTRKYDNGNRLDDPPLMALGLYDKARMENEIYPYMVMDTRQPDLGEQLIPAYLCNKPGKRQLYLDHYIQDERIRNMEDFAMMYELLYAADTMYVCTDCLYIYRIHAQSYLSRYHADYFQTLRLCRDYIYQRIGKDIPVIEHQLDIWTALITLSTIWDEFRHGHKYSYALHHVRTELNNTQLVKGLSTAGLPLLKKVYIRLLQAHFYGIVMTIAWVQTKLSLDDVTAPRYDRGAQ
jgi:glycosyltransferase involved in cell wall biosynthesis